MTRHPVRPDRVVSAVWLTITAIGFGLHAAPARSDEPATIVWREDYASALGDAQAANSLLWIQFTGPWCPNCTRMERDSFPNSAIVEHSQRSFLPVKLRSDLNEQLVAAFNVTAIPATIVVAPNRDIIGFHQGYLGPAELDALLRDCIERSAPAPPRDATPASPGSKPGIPDRKQPPLEPNRSSRSEAIARSA